MDPYGIHLLTVTRHDELAREADESRLARLAEESHEESAPAPAPRSTRARRLGFAR